MERSRGLRRRDGGERYRGIKREVEKEKRGERRKKEARGRRKRGGRR